MLGSSPSGSREFEAGMESARKDLFTQRYKERLGKNSVVGKLVEKRGWITWFTWDTNKTSRQEVWTTYIGHRRPLEQWRVPRLGLPLTWVLEARAKLGGLVSIHAPDGNSARRGKKEWHRGISLSRNWSVFIFRFAYILFVIHRDEYRVTWGSVDLTLVKIRCFI